MYRKNEMEISKMDVNRILSELDAEIARLQHIRAALTGAGTSTVIAAARSGRGRPKGSKNAPKPAATRAVQVAASKPVAAKATKGKRKLSPEGRKRIADAMKRRWAERRKEAAKK
jgi:hypothetical protein